MSLLYTIALVGAGIILGSLGTILVIYRLQMDIAEKDYENRTKETKKEN